MSLGRGLGSGSGGWWGAVFLWKIREKGKGVGGGGGEGTGKGAGKSMHKLLAKPTFKKLPFRVSPRCQLYLCDRHHTRARPPTPPPKKKTYVGCSRMSGRMTWELRFLSSFTSFPREIPTSKNVWETPGSPRHPSSRHLRPSDYAKETEELF